jgi:hypothetical protein
VLPEMLMFELTKHPDDWEGTVRRSLEYVVRCPEALVIAHTAKDLGVAEEATGQPCLLASDRISRRMSGRASGSSSSACTASGVSAMHTFVEASLERMRTPYSPRPQ